MENETWEEEENLTLHYLHNNVSSNETQIDTYFFYVDGQLATLWFLFISILAGNISVLLALSQTKRRKSRVNFFIQHLALADLSVGLGNVLTDIIWKMTLEWTAGNTACKLIKYAQGLVTYCSSYVLVAMTIDRYQAIRHPMSFSHGHRRSRYLIISAWGLSGIFSSPLLFFFNEQIIQKKLQCWIDFPEPWHWQVYLTVVSITVFFVPAFIIAVCYSVIIYTIWSKSSVTVMRPKCNNNWGNEDDSKRASSRGLIPKAKVKTVKMTLVIVFVFIACWSPYFVYNLMYVYGLISMSQTSNAVSTFIQSLACLNSAMNPVIYWSFSTNLCRDFRNKPQWSESSRAGRSMRVTDSTSITDTSYVRGNVQLQSLTSAQRKLILRSVSVQMGINEGLSERSKAFLVESLLDTSSQDNVLWHKGIGIELCGRDLWKEFHSIGTEMLVTKAGRRMFPTLKLRFHGLSSSLNYIVFMDIMPVGNARYKYAPHSSQWTITGSKHEAEISENRIYIHPDSPASGQLWTSQGHVSFHEVKLTNNRDPIVRGQVTLQSMHKYQPRVHVLQIPPCFNLPNSTLLEYVVENVGRAATFVFPVTSFITVTAYQNQAITKLKIRCNPFAKGYREMK